MMWMTILIVLWIKLQLAVGLKTKATWKRYIFQRLSAYFSDAHMIWQGGMEDEEKVHYHTKALLLGLSLPTFPSPWPYELLSGGFLDLGWKIEVYRLCFVLYASTAPLPVDVCIRMCVVGLCGTRIWLAYVSMSKVDVNRAGRRF